MTNFMKWLLLSLCSLNSRLIRLQVQPEMYRKLIDQMLVPSPKLKSCFQKQLVRRLKVSVPNEEGCEMSPSLVGLFIKLILQLIARVVIDISDKSYCIIAKQNQWVNNSSFCNQFYFQNKVTSIQMQRKRRTLAAATAGNSIHCAIEHILSKGAEALYDKYITAKLPNHLRKDIQPTMRNIFGQMASCNGGQKTDLSSIHEPMINKIQVAGRGKSNCSQIKQYPAEISQVNELLASKKQLGRKKDNDNLSKRQNQQNTVCQLIPCPNGWFEPSSTPSQIQQRQDKQKRDYQLKLKEDQIKREKQHAGQIRRHLEHQLERLQQQHQPIPFDYQTGRIIEHTEAHRQQPHQVNTIQIHYHHQQKESQRYRHPPPKCYVKSTRNIISFERPRRKKLVIDEDMDQTDYNNNGERQQSSVPYMSVEEGVVLKEEGGRMSEHRERNIHSAKSSSMTHRTFKSYTKQLMNSYRYSRTIGTSTSVGRTKMLVAHQSKQTNKTSLCSRKHSILWSNNAEKHHTITKNPQFSDSYFEFSGVFE